MSYIFLRNKIALDQVVDDDQSVPSVQKRFYVLAWNFSNSNQSNFSSEKSKPLFTAYCYVYDFMIFGCVQKPHQLAKKSENLFIFCHFNPTCETATDWWSTYSYLQL